MAALIQPHWHTITPELRSLLRLLEGQAFLSRFYLAGGTALALQLGHRRSVDLGFFSEMDAVGLRARQEIIQALQHSGVQVLENADGNLLVLVGNIHVGFFSYGYPLLEDPLTLGAVNLASCIDIGLMKCDALITRGSRKDFYDLYFLSRLLPLENLLLRAEQKYSYYRDFALTVIESMLAFENADRDLQPVLFEDIPWLVIKDHFRREAVQLARFWMQLE